MTTTTKANRAIGIIRVSGAAQVDKFGPDAQEVKIRARADELGADLLDVWPYQEGATPGTDRSEFDELRQRLLRKSR